MCDDEDAAAVAAFLTEAMKKHRGVCAATPRCVESRYFSVIKHWAVQKSGHRDTPMQEVVVMVAAMAVKMLMTMPMIVFHNFAFMMFKLF